MKEEESCQEISTLASLYCANNNPQIFDWSFAVIDVLLIALSIWMLFKSKKKIKMIKKPSPNWESLDYDETYSEFSITIIYFIFGLMVTIIIDALLNLYSIILKENYFDTFFSGSSCDKSMKPGYKWVAVIEVVNQTVSQILL